MSNNEESRFITIKVAAKMLGVSPLTLRNWDKKKKLAAFRHPINNYRVYKLQDIQEFLDKIGDSNKPKKVRIDFISDDDGDVDSSISADEGELRI